MNMNNKTTWTPGPWKIDTDTQGYVVLVAGQRTVCLVGPEEDPTSEDDARLIALAPEMAEALRELASMADGGRDEFNRVWENVQALKPGRDLDSYGAVIRGEFLSISNKARALLARLEGGQ